MAEYKENDGIPIDDVHSDDDEDDECPIDDSIDDNFRYLVRYWELANFLYVLIKEEHFTFREIRNLETTKADKLT